MLNPPFLCLWNHQTVEANHFSARWEWLDFQRLQVCSLHPTPIILLQFLSSPPLLPCPQRSLVGSQYVNGALEMPWWMPDISAVDSVREQLWLKARKSPSIRFLQLEYFTRVLTSTHIQCRNVMSPLSEHPLTLSVNCSSSFQHPWWNLCFNYLMFFIASFQFMISRKPDSIVCLALYCWQIRNQWQCYRLAQCARSDITNAWKCGSMQWLKTPGHLYLQTKIINCSQDWLESACNSPSSFPFSQNLFCSQNCYQESTVPLPPEPWRILHIKLVSNATNMPDLT